jgi:hypothetical protein
MQELHFSDVYQEGIVNRLSSDSEVIRTSTKLSSSQTLFSRLPASRYHLGDENIRKQSDRGNQFLDLFRR